MTENQSNESHLKSYYSILEEQASDVIQKIKHLKSVIPKNGLAVQRYPSGTLLETIKKVTGSLNGKLSLNGNHYIKFDASHQSTFHLVMNSSPLHDDFEKIQSKTGGIHSTEVIDLGDFLIVEVCDGIVQSGADFSLYRTKDDFHF